MKAPILRSRLESFVPDHVLRPSDASIVTCEFPVVNPTSRDVVFGSSCVALVHKYFEQSSDH